MENFLTPQDVERLVEKLRELKTEHRDLDQVIDHLATNPPPDQLLLPRLKKRRLGLKDQIHCLETQLMPDELA